MFFTLVGTTIEAVNLLGEFLPLILLKNSERYLNVFTPGQLQALTYSLLQLQGIGFNLALVFFGFYCIAMGFLVFTSRFFYRVVGVFMAIGGTCYLFNSFATFIAPRLAAGLFPYIQLPSGLAELSFCLCLLVKGLNVKKWEEKANVVQVSAH